jgi:hypothetical protein
LARSRLAAATLQTAAQAAKAQLIPMDDAADPITILPSDQSPRSIKNKLSTRPNKFGGDSI